MNITKHHRSKLPFEIVEKARDMREYEKMEIRDIQHKLSSSGIDVPYWTLVDFIYYRTRVYR